MENMDQPSWKVRRALAKKLRAQMLVTLSEQVASTREMAAGIGENLAIVAYHARVLVECGLIEVDREETRRGRVERFYRLRR